MKRTNENTTKQTIGKAEMTNASNKKNDASATKTAPKATTEQGFRILSALLSASATGKDKIGAAVDALNTLDVGLRFGAVRHAVRMSPEHAGVLEAALAKVEHVAQATRSVDPNQPYTLSVWYPASGSSASPQIQVRAHPNMFSNDRGEVADTVKIVPDADGLGYSLRVESWFKGTTADLMSHRKQKRAEKRGETVTSDGESEASDDTENQPKKTIKRKAK